MSVLTKRRLEVELSLRPEPINVREDQNWIHVGAISLSKKYPRYSVGFTHPIVDNSRFEREHFDLGNQRGWAIVFHSGGTPSDYFAGWMPESEDAQAALLVSRLNALTQELIGAAKRARSNEAVEVLTFHEGAEYAPDSPWGIETLRLSRDGELEYERRRAGKIMETAHGHVDADRVAALIGALARTDFPAPPQEFFPPGASVCTLITEPPFRRMDIELSSGLRLDGYSEILKALNGLCTHLRDEDERALADWRFTGEFERSS